MTLTITYSSEMMTNNLQARLIAPQKKFEALQTADGHSLLFAIDSDGTFNVIREQSGNTAAGWTVTDLSSDRISRDYPSGGATVATFEVGQSVADGSYGMAMVVSSKGENQLYLSLGNSSSDLSWIAAPNWTAYPYDDPSIALSSLEIVDVYFCEPTGTTQYIIVDVVRDPSSAVKDVHRFYIDPSRTSGHSWNSHDLPIDIEVGSYDSVLGRLPNGFVDGLYTAGRAGGSGQLAFVPIVNAFGSGPPLPVRLDLPDAAVPDAVASVRNADQSTDLFVVSGTTLYYFASTNQADGATPATVLDSDVLEGTTRLAAVLHDGVVTLWGRNGSDEVYSISCRYAAVTDTSAWTVPLPILAEVEHLSPYVNAVDGGNTIFAAGAGAVERITQSDQNGLWVTDKITLPAPPTEPSITFDSYTTSIQVTGDDGLPAGNVSVELASNRRTAVYINGIYYLVDSSPIHVSTTSVGTITIVEATGTLAGTTFTVSAGGGAGVTIDPMAGPFNKLATLDTADKLAAATITGQGGSTRPLVPEGTKRDDLSTVADGLSKLASCYGKVAAAPPTGPLAAAGVTTASTTGDDAIVVAIGDLFRWLETGVEAVVKVVEDEADAVWHFVAEIGDAAYKAVIDSVAAVVSAAQWLFNAIETAVEDLIRYVEFLFEWDDIGRTKAVFHNLLRVYLAGQVDELQVFKSEIDQAIGELEQTIDTWAGISDWSALGGAAGKPAAAGASNPMHGQTAASQHLLHHFQNNSADVSIIGDAPAPDLLQSVIDDLFTALSSEATVLDEVIDRLDQLASDFSTLTVEEVLRRLVGILADGVLGSTQVVIDAILDILTDVASAALAILDTKIHIPVISDILNAIGVPDVSFLDLFCWIAAVAYTVVYKIAEGVAPFPDDDTTAFLSTAPSIEDLEQAFAGTAATTHPETPQLAAMAAGPATRDAVGADDAGDPVALPPSVAEAVFAAGHSLAGFFTLMSDFVSTFEAAEESGDNPWGIPSAVLGVLGGGSVGVTNLLVPRDPIANKFVSSASSATTAIRILAKIIFSGPLQKKFAASTNVMQRLAVGDGRATGAIVDAILVVPALAASGYHFYEIAQQPASKPRTDAILEEVSSLTSYVSRVAYAVAVNDDDPESRAIVIGVMAVANLATAGLQTAEAIVG